MLRGKEASQIMDKLRIIRQKVRQTFIKLKIKRKPKINKTVNISENQKVKVLKSAKKKLIQRNEK